MAPHPLVNDMDSDGDGIADGWEVLMGLDPVIADADADPDQDGLTSIQEYMGLDETPPIYDYKLIESHCLSSLSRRFHKR